MEVVGVVGDVRQGFEADPKAEMYVSYLQGAPHPCLLYTSDAADDLLCVDLGGRRIIKKKKPPYQSDIPTRSFV